MLQTIQATIKANPFGSACAAIILFAALAFVVFVGYTSFVRSERRELADLLLAGFALWGAVQVALWSLHGIVRAVEWLDGVIRRYVLGG